MVGLLGVIERFKLPATVTVALAVPVQEPVAPKTEYTVVIVGLAATIEPLVGLTEDIGVQV